MPIRVMPICTVERNLPGSFASASAHFAPPLPFSAAIFNRAGRAETTSDLFIYPGFEFRVLSGLVTNFHLPQSSLVMLVSAFGGRDAVMRAYGEAVAQGYRFYSYGDAMLVI